MSIVSPVSLYSSITSALFANVTIITITARDYMQAIPGFQAGVSYVQFRYPNVHIEYEHFDRPDLPSCTFLSYDIDALVSDYYYAKKKPSDLTAFLSPLCTQELFQFSPLATQWTDVIVMATSGSDATISNRTVYPINLTCATHHNSFTVTFMRYFLDKFNWTTVFLLCDKNDDVAFYQATCLGMTRLLQSNTTKYLMISYSFDSSRKDDVNYELYLSQFAISARVMVVAARVDIVRNLMIAAGQRGMAGSDYVYIHHYSFYFVNNYEAPSWYRNDSNDEVAKLAFRSLISITFDNERTIDALPNETKEFIYEESMTEYNISYGYGERISATTVSAFESVVATTMVLQEVLDDASSTGRSVKDLLSDTRVLAKRFWNRTLPLPTGNAYFDGNGDHYPDVLLRQFNYATGKYEEALRFGPAELIFKLMRPQGLVWPGGKAPVNEPRCGYDGQKPICFDENHIIAATIAIACALIVAVGVITPVCVRLYSKYMENRSPWWKIGSHQLDTPKPEKPNSFFRSLQKPSTSQFSAHSTVEVAWQEERLDT